MNSSIKAILWNGVKGCGKDYAKEQVHNHLRYYVNWNPFTSECKLSLINMTKELFRVSEGDWNKYYHNRDYKEERTSVFTIPHLASRESHQLNECLNYWPGEGKWIAAGKNVVLSSREALIYVSEVLIKPRFGDDYWGKKRAEHAERMIKDGGCNIILDGSLGFTEEVIPLLDVVDKENILVIRVEVDGEDTKGDSRHLIEEGVFPNFVRIKNVFTDQYITDTLNAVEEFLEGGANHE